MATWDEVRQRLRETFALDADEEHEVVLTLPRERGGRLQRVMVRRHHAWDRELVEVRSAFGEVGEAEPLDLLEESLRLPLGAIARHGRFLVLVEKASLEHTTVDGVVFLLTRVSLLADRLEERRGGDRF